MFFGKRKQETILGEFSSEKCRACKKSYTYQLKKATTFLVAFFINLIPLSSKYECVCSDCGAVEPVDKAAGRETARTKFPGKQAKDHILIALRIAAFCLVIAAAIVLPLKLIKVSSPDPDFLKSLVTENGNYNIENSDGDILATIEVSDSDKVMSFYDDVSVLTSEPGADGTFLLHKYYCETTESGGDTDGTTALVRYADDPGELKDRYLTTIRSYYYNESTDSTGYNMGIEDLTAIEYTPDKVTYPLTYYVSASQTENYLQVLYLKESMKLNATLMPSESGGEADQLVSVSIDELESGRTSTQTIYYFDDDTISLAGSSGLSADSTMDEILAFIDENALSPTIISDFSYYNDTGVVTQITMSHPDSDGTMQTITQDFEITEKSGYYLQKAVES